LVSFRIHTDVDLYQRACGLTGFVAIGRRRLALLAKVTLTANHRMQK